MPAPVATDIQFFEADRRKLVANRSPEQTYCSFSPLFMPLWNTLRPGASIRIFLSEWNKSFDQPITRQLKFSFRIHLELN